MTRKSDDSPLTRADRLSHAIIVKGLGGCEDREHRERGQPPLRRTSPPSAIHHSPSAVCHPRAGSGPFPVLSEEGAGIPYDARKHWRTLWIVDPLDGTKEFIKRNGEFTVNIALVHDRRPVLGVVYAPVPDRLYFGLEGVDAFRLDAANAQLGNQNAGCSVERLISLSRRLPLRDARVPHHPSGLCVVASLSSQSSNVAFSQNRNVLFG